MAAAGIPLTIIGKRWKLDPQAFWRLKEHVARLRPDLIHTWMFAANTYGFAAARACGVKNVVIGQRCVDPWKSRLQLAIDRAIGPACRCVVVNSEGVRDFYVAHGTPAERVRVIPNGVAIARPAEPPRGGNCWPSLELPENSRLVGLVGRLWPQKRVKDAIWAADLLKVIRDDVHLLVIGDGPQRDRLRRYRDQCRIRDKVHFLGERGDVPRLMPHFDVLWSTSGYEGQSNVILEAMAAGVPVVATDIPGTRELVVAGRDRLSRARRRSGRFRQVHRADFERPRPGRPALRRRAKARAERVQRGEDDCAARGIVSKGIVIPPTPIAFLPKSGRRIFCKRLFAL